jgi:hypothetical protein
MNAWLSGTFNPLLPGNRLAPGMNETERLCEAHYHYMLISLRAQEFLSLLLAVAR